MLISYGSDLGLSALCALFTLTVNNFLYGQNLTKPFEALFYILCIECINL